MANWAKNFDEENDKRREKGLKHRLSDLENKLKNVKDMQEEKILLNRILDIMNELQTEAFDYDKDKFLRYYVRFKNINVNIEAKENKKREDGLNRALNRYIIELKQTEKNDYEAQYILLNRINNIYSEIDLEGFFHYPEEKEKYLKEQLKVKTLLDKKKEQEKEKRLMEKHQEKDTSWQEFKEEEEDFDR